MNSTLQAPERDAYWDNAKMVLILLVVLGHFLIPVQSRGRSVHAAFTFIYLFHMPAFVFISGYFSRSYARHPIGKANKLTGFLVLYLVFVMCDWAINSHFTHTWALPQIFLVYGAPWYMLSMFFWYLLIPYFAQLRWQIALPMSIVTALLAGCEPLCAGLLSVSRTLVFFPFFLAGYYFHDRVHSKLPVAAKLLAGLVLAAAVYILLFHPGRVDPWFNITYGSNPYRDLHLTMSQGVKLRAFWYAVSSVMTASVLCLIPRRRLPFTYIGERTLAVYFIHRLLRDVLQYMGLYDHLGTGVRLLVSLIALSLLIAWVTAAKPFSMLLNTAFKLHPKKELQTI